MQSSAGCHPQLVKSFSVSHYSDLGAAYRFAARQLCSLFLTHPAKFAPALAPLLALVRSLMRLRLGFPPWPRFGTSAQ